MLPEMGRWSPLAEVGNSAKAVAVAPTGADRGRRLLVGWWAARHLTVFVGSCKHQASTQLQGGAVVAREARSLAPLEGFPSARAQGGAPQTKRCQQN